MSSNIIKPKPQVIPGIIANNYPTELDLLNCVSLKARFDLRDINTFHKNIKKKNMEYRQELLRSKLKAREKEEDSSWETNNLLYEFKMLINNRKKNLKYNYGMTPIEEREKNFVEFYKILFRQIQKKGGMNNYINRIVPNFLKIEKAQRNIQKYITKSKIILIKNKYKEENINKLPLLEISSNNNNSILEKKIKNMPLLKLTSFNKNNNSSINNSKNKMPLLKLFSLNPNADTEENNSSINILNENNKNNNMINNAINRNISKDKIKEKKIIKKIFPKNKRNRNRSYDNIIPMNKNYIPFTNASEFKTMSNGVNIKFHNSIFRTKNINEYVNPYNSNEINNIFKKIKENRKKYINKLLYK